MEIYILLVGLITVVLGPPAKFQDPMINEGLFEGDMLRDPYEFVNAVPDDSRRWPHGVVTYAISSELIPESVGPNPIAGMDVRSPSESALNNEIKPFILSAMQHLESVSCLRFVERTDQDDYIWIYLGSGCFSHWGRTGGKQDLSLGNGCNNFAIIVHELMHAIGFEHEHSRSDRDDYLIINWENIDEEQWYNFKKLEPNQNRLLTQFDDFSILLYGSRTSAKDYYSDKYSMVRKDGSYIEEVYNKTSVSILDIMKINFLYECYL